MPDRCDKVERLATALVGIRWKANFVDDDSADGTSDRAREISPTAAHICVVQRLGRRGLASATIEGMLWYVPRDSISAVGQCGRSVS